MDAERVRKNEMKKMLIEERMEEYLAKIAIYAIDI